MIKMYIDIHIKYLLFLPDIEETWIFFDKLSKNTQIPNFMQIRPMGGEFYHVDEQTDMTKPVAAFRNF